MKYYWKCSKCGCLNLVESEKCSKCGKQFSAWFNNFKPDKLIVGLKE